MNSRTETANSPQRSSLPKVQNRRTRFPARLHHAGSFVLGLSAMGCISEKPAFDEKTGAPWPFERWVQVEAELPTPTPSTYKGDCTFAGSIDQLKRMPPLVVELGAAKIEAVLQYANFAQLQVEEGVSNGMQGVLTYPVSSSVSITTQAARLLLASERIDYVKNYLWQDAGRPVQVDERRGDQLLVRPPTKLLPQSRPPLQPSYEAFVPCSHLELTPVSFQITGETPGLKSEVLLHDSPHGEIVAQLGAAGDPIQILEQAGDWLHVIGLDEEYRYEGWVSANSVQEKSFSVWLELQEAVVKPSHRVTRDTNLSLSHTLSDEGIVLPRGQVVYSAETRKGVSRVFVPHLRLPRYGSFFVRADALEAL